MKKVNRVITVLFAMMTVLLSSCHDNIYELIDREVSLEKNGLNGDLSIVRYGDYLIASNGNFFYKTNQPSAKTGKYNEQWRKAPKPSSHYSSEDLPDKTSSIASDGTYLYALVKSYKESNRGYSVTDYTTLYCTNTANPSDLNWKKVDLSSICGSGKNFGIRVVFDNKYVNITEAADHEYTTDLSLRNAYARIRKDDGTYGCFKLNGESVPEEVSDNGANGSTISSIYFKGSDYFFPYSAVTANDTYMYYSKTYSTTSTANRIYYTTTWSYDSNEKKYVSDGGSVDPDAHGILSMAAANNYILLGTTKGLYHVKILDDKTPNNDHSGFSASNAGSVITEWVWKVFVLNPDKDEDSKSIDDGTDCYACSTIYGSISSSSDPWTEAGLYSYYPGRGIWNRDGTNDDSSGGN